MKAFFLSLLLCAFSPLLFAQIPGLSLSAKTEQMVGTTKVTLEYTRPTARGREIYGGLVPYGKTWQTGGGLAVISFNEPIRFGDDEVPAGSYALLTVPGKQEWTVMLNPSTDYSPSLLRDRSTDVTSVRVPARKTGRYYEALSLELDVTQNDARLFISWTDVMVSVPIKTDALDRVVAHVDSLLSATVGADSYTYVEPLGYLLFNKTEGARAVALANVLQRMDSNRYYPYDYLSSAHLLNGNKTEALAASAQAIAQAKIEFADDPETLRDIVAGLERKRAALLDD